MDLADRATPVVEAWLDGVIGRVVARFRADQEATDAVDCVGCRYPIPDARRLAVPSAERCIDCQTDHEANVRVGR